MIITNFSISDDATQLDLTITDAATIGSLRLWTDKTYKDFSLAIDLSTKLTGGSTEDIVITLSDIGESYFDGIYFIEAEDEDELALEYTYELAKYDECILNRIMYLKTCNECLLEEDADLLNSSALLEGLIIALNRRFIDEILSLIETLNKYCSNECTTCGKFKNILTVTSEDSIGSSTITIALDGGTSD